MDIIRYKMENFESCDEYIFQFISERKLSNIYHCHEFYEIILVLDGSCVQNINSCTYTMHKANCTILTPNDFHCFTNQSDDCKLLGLSVAKPEFEAFFKSFKNVPIPDTAISFSCINKLSELLNLTEECSVMNSSVHCKLILCNLFAVYFTNPKINDDTSLPSSIIKAMSQIRTNDNLKEGMNTFVKLCGYSYPHIYRLMKKHIGKNPHEYLKEVCLEVAYNKLISSDIPIDEISESVGYKSFSHFNSIFKKKYGVSAATIRKDRKLLNTL